MDNLNYNNRSKKFLKTFDLLVIHVHVIGQSYLLSISLQFSSGSQTNASSTAIILSLCSLSTCMRLAHVILQFPSMPVTFLREKVKFKSLNMDCINCYLFLRIQCLQRCQQLHLAIRETLYNNEGDIQLHFHPANSLFELMTSGKRYRAIRADSNRTRNSFYPSAIRLLIDYSF